MKPRNRKEFYIYLIISAISAFILLARFAGYIHVSTVTVVACSVAPCVLIAYTARDFARKPYEKDYHDSDWTVIDSMDRHGVSIVISESVHKAGNKPSYVFERAGPSYCTNFEVHNKKGDLTIYFGEGSFMMRPYKSFRIKIS